MKSFFNLVNKKAKKRVLRQNPGWPEVHNDRMFLEVESTKRLNHEMTIYDSKCELPKLECVQTKLTVGKGRERSANLLQSFAKKHSKSTTVHWNT